MPELPAITPATNIRPTFNANLPTATDLHLDFNTDRLSDSLAIYQQDWNGYRQTPLPRFSYDTNPYSRDWSSGGVIARIGGGYLTGGKDGRTADISRCTPSTYLDGVCCANIQQIGKPRGGKNQVSNAHRPVLPPCDECLPGTSGGTGYLDGFHTTVDF